MIFSFSKESILFLYNIFSYLLNEYIDLRKPSNFLFLKTKQNKNHKQMDILFLPSVLWYIIYPFIIGDSICAQPHVSHDDGIYQKEFLNEVQRVTHFLIFMIFITAQLCSVAVLLATLDWLSLWMAKICPLIFKHLVNLHGHSN